MRLLLRWLGVSSVVGEGVTVMLVAAELSTTGRSFVGAVGMMFLLAISWGLSTNTNHLCGVRSEHKGMTAMAYVDGAPTFTTYDHGYGVITSTAPNVSNRSMSCVEVTTLHPPRVARLDAAQAW